MIVCLAGAAVRTRIDVVLFASPTVMMRRGSAAAPLIYRELSKGLYSALEQPERKAAASAIPQSIVLFILFIALRMINYLTGGAMIRMALRRAGYVPALPLTVYSYSMW